MPNLRNYIMRCTACIGYGTRTFLVSAALVLIFVFLLMHNTAEYNGPDACGEKLTLFCAAGMKGPVADAVEKYKAEYGIDVAVQYAGSGTLFSNIKIVKSGDLYIAADDSYIKMGQDEGLIAESIPLATIIPVIAVKKGNPQGLTNIEDLYDILVVQLCRGTTFLIKPLHVLSVLTEPAGQHLDRHFTIQR